MKTRHITSVMLAIVLMVGCEKTIETPDADAGSCDDCTIAYQLEGLGPDNALNCGHTSDHPAFPADEPQTVLTCIGDALADGVDFTVTHMGFGTDSTIMDAWFSKDGDIVRLIYDSHPCGGDAGCLTACGPRTYRSVCNSPSLVAVDDFDGGFFDCAAPSTSELVCGVE